MTTAITVQVLSDHSQEAAIAYCNTFAAAIDAGPWMLNPCTPTACGNLHCTNVRAQYTCDVSQNAELAKKQVMDSPIANINRERSKFLIRNRLMPVSLRSRKEPCAVWLKCPVGQERKVRCMLYPLCVDVQSGFVHTCESPKVAAEVDSKKHSAVHGTLSLMQVMLFCSRDCCKDTLLALQEE